MKALRSWLQGRQFLILTFAILSCVTKVFAQTADSNLVPVVTVQATQPIATAANSGVFTLFRAGDTNLALNVWYDLDGTASNGVDYALIPPHLITIAAGAISNTVVITPLTNSPSSSTAKTVVLTLTNSPLMTPVNYQIGTPSQAIVYIKANGATNLPPTVNLFEPKNGDVFYTPTNILLAAKAGDLDGSVTNVEFFAGAKDLGPGTPLVLDPPGMNGVTGLIYVFNWLDVPAGDYPLTAVATDNGGASTTSAPIDITVLQGPPTNLPPVVRIVSPANGATFFAPVDIPLFAYARDFDGSVQSVEFFAGTNDLGSGQRLPTPVAANSPSPSPIPPIYPTNLFVLVWSNTPIGNYAVTAKATDNDGASTVSDPIQIAVLPSPPPPTNTPVVSIVATDPVAIEGTNCWVWAGETNTTPSWADWSASSCRWFTNCGPKIATFTVRRSGNTNSDLTVPYHIGGTASNGVDYVMLPGAVVIPAGERRARIPVIPIDDGPPDVNKTVVLTLVPSTVTVWPPPYLVGFPGRAAAIILDPGPRPVAGSLVGRCFHFKETGPNAAWFCIEYSTNMFNWTPVCTNQVIDGSIDFVDPDAAGNVSSFYRAVPLATSPAD